MKGGQVDILYLAVLGLVQGLCEFLPISSSGHLVLLSNLFNIEDSLFVSIILHVATLLAVVIVLRKEVWQIIRHPFSNEAMNIYIATIPTAIIVLILMPIVNLSFGGGFLAISFLISALLLLFSEHYYKKKEVSFQKDFSYKNALIMGVAQGLAVFPGISRSGTTICAGLLSGAKKEDSAKFSFLMSIPIIILSLLMEIFKIIVQKEPISVNVIGLIISFAIAFVIGILSIKLMLKLTQKLSFKWFSLYLLAIAVLTLILI